MSDLQQSLTKLKEASDLFEQDLQNEEKANHVMSLHQALYEMQQQLEDIKTQIEITDRPALRYVD
jgi:capsule polysaccharide export protein KpsE/RkpR